MSLNALWPATLALLLPRWLLVRHERVWHRLGLLAELRALLEAAGLPESGGDSLLVLVLKAWREGRHGALQHYLASGDADELELPPTLREDLRQATHWPGQEAREICHCLLEQGAGDDSLLGPLCRVWDPSGSQAHHQLRLDLQALMGKGGAVAALAESLVQALERGQVGAGSRVAEHHAGAGGASQLARRERQRQREICQLACHQYGRMVGASPAFLELERRLRQAAGDRLPVLLTGETGTGKELAVDYLHRMGFPSGSPLVAVNCGALSENLAEAELFGSTKGAFTGAVERDGLVAQAEGGLLFLDEFASLPPTVQARLLRFLESGVYRRMGEWRERQVRVRVVAATCEVERLQRDVRQDLLHRVAGRILEVPALAERREDIPLLVKAFLLEEGQDELALNPLLSTRHLAVLGRASWPGNIRQLRHTVLRLCKVPAKELEQELKLIDKQDHSPNVKQPQDWVLGGVSLKQALAHFEEQCIHQTLEACGQDRRVAARRLGISVPTLYSRLREAGARRQSV